MEKGANFNAALIWAKKEKEEHVVKLLWDGLRDFHVVRLFERDVGLRMLVGPLKAFIFGHEQSRNPKMKKRARGEDEGDETSTFHKKRRV